jgi:hypothetical protein
MERKKLGYELEEELKLISKAQKELIAEDYYIRVGGKLIDPNGDIYWSGHPVIERARAIRK